MQTWKIFYKWAQSFASHADLAVKVITLAMQWHDQIMLNSLATDDLFSYLDRSTWRMRNGI